MFNIVEMTNDGDRKVIHRGFPTTEAAREVMHDMASVAAKAGANVVVSRMGFRTYGDPEKVKHQIFRIAEASEGYETAPAFRVTTASRRVATGR